MGREIKKKPFLDDEWIVTELYKTDPTEEETDAINKLSEIIREGLLKDPKLAMQIYELTESHTISLSLVGKSYTENTL